MSYEPTLTPEKDEIFACGDEARLNAWHRELYDLFDEVQSRIEAYRSAGTADEEWVRRAAGKVARTKRAIRFVERRMAELGLDLPPTRAGREGEMLRQLRSKVRELEKQNAQLREAAA